MGFYDGRDGSKKDLYRHVHLKTSEEKSALFAGTGYGKAGTVYEKGDLADSMILPPRAPDSGLGLVVVLRLLVLKTGD